MDGISTKRLKKTNVCRAFALLLGSAIFSPPRALSAGPFSVEILDF